MRNIASFLLARCVNQRITSAAEYTGAREFLDFGSIPPLPHLGHPIIPREQGDCCCQTRPEELAQVRSHRLAISLFGMSRGSVSEGKHLLSAMRAEADYLFLADLKIPERNIEIPCGVLMRGIIQALFPLHRDFLRHGGLEGILCTEEKLALVCRTTLLGGGVLCTLLHVSHN